MHKIRKIMWDGEQRYLATQRVVDRQWAGLLYGLLGVLAFSLTLPATRLAVASFGPTAVGLGRALVAAVLAGAFLALRRQPFPRRDIAGLLIVAGGVILGFPLLTAWAMVRVPASHGAVILGLLPLATAAAAALRAGERPSRAFWLASSAGSAVVIAFSLQNGIGGLEVADLALLAAVAAAAMGYAEGGRLARHLGGLEVISWALVMSVPVVALLGGPALVAMMTAAPRAAWISFGYVSVFSQFLGFAAWYRGLALGGVARVGQVQLLQPFFTILGSVLLLGEAMSITTVGAALLVVLMVAIGRKAPIESKPLNENA